ncbi:hypothetical protein RF11_09331 [Thelohanellus kitauei]|uniref:Uncharacterized protein n=1 Tax=Thelohanellus kitauei TaxID=669202 RepID=A0A0C2MR04_THEKT|nr:hypothetical protein RF11_09331 [Thelohanellus kitauei]
MDKEFTIIIQVIQSLFAIIATLGPDDSFQVIVGDKQIRLTVERILKMNHVELENLLLSHQAVARCDLVCFITLFLFNLDVIATAWFRQSSAIKFRHSIDSFRHRVDTVKQMSTN